MPPPSISVDDSTIGSDSSTASHFNPLLHRNRQTYYRAKEEEARKLAATFHNRQIHCRANEEQCKKIASSFGKFAKFPNTPTSPSAPKPPFASARVQSLLPLAFSTKPTTKFRRRHQRFKSQQKMAAISRRVDELTLLQLQNKKQPPNVVIHDVDAMDDYKGGSFSVPTLPAGGTNSSAQSRDLTNANASSLSPHPPTAQPDTMSYHH
jgi:hypothetical protein